jgi:hypothetical protein
MGAHAHKKIRKAGKIEVSVNGGDGGLCHWEISKYFIHFSDGALRVKQPEKLCSTSICALPISTEDGRENQDNKGPG